MPFKKKASAFTIINLFDSTPLLVTCLFVYTVQRDWRPINEIIFALGCVTLVLGLICPESPRWLLLTEQSEKAKETLNYIARMNCSGKSIPQEASLLLDEEQAVNEAEDVSIQKGIKVAKLSSQLIPRNFTAGLRKQSSLVQRQEDLKINLMPTHTLSV